MWINFSKGGNIVDDVFNELKREAEYAQELPSNLLYEVYGKTKWFLGAINKEEFMELNHDTIYFINTNQQVFQNLKTNRKEFIWKHFTVSVVIWLTLTRVHVLENRYWSKTKAIGKREMLNYAEKAFVPWNRRRSGMKSFSGNKSLLKEWRNKDGM